MKVVCPYETLVANLYDYAVSHARRPYLNIHHHENLNLTEQSQYINTLILGTKLYDIRDQSISHQPRTNLLFMDT